MPLATRIVKATDTFASSISASWVNGPGGWNDMAWISANNIRGGSNLDCAMRRDAETFNENQYSKTTVSTLDVGAGSYCSVHAEVAMQAGSSAACYFGQLRCVDGRYAIYETDAGFGVTELARTGTATGSFPAGSWIVLERVWNGTTNELDLYSAEGGAETLRLSTTDATIRGGKPGCGANADVTSIAISAWEGGDDGLQTLVQNTRFDNTPVFYTGNMQLVYTGMFDEVIFDDAIFDTTSSGPSPQTLVQATRFSNSNSFFNGTINFRLFQTARFNNSNTFFGGRVNFRLNQGTRFNNSNNFFAGQINLRLLQGTRFSNSNTFYSGVVSLSGGALTLVQDARFNNSNQFFGSRINFVLAGTRYNNANQFYGGRINLRLIGNRFDNTNEFFAGSTRFTLTQNTRFNNTNQYFAGRINLVLQGSRFDNSNQFFGGTVSLSSVSQTLVQDSRFDNTQTFFGGSIIQPGVFTTSTVYWG